MPLDRKFRDKGKLEAWFFGEYYEKSIVTYSKSGDNYVWSLLGIFQISMAVNSGGNYARAQ